MAITRRQFVTRMGTLAAAMGMSQVDMAQVVQAFGHSNTWTGAWTTKPKVVWVHGAECTGCSTSLLSLFEDVQGIAVEGTNITTLAALDLAVGGDGLGAKVLYPYDVTPLGVPNGPNPHPNGHRTLNTAGYNVDGNAFVANIADVLVDFIDLQYHETVMSMGGALAYEWLLDTMTEAGDPFVLVVEGAIQPKDGVGAWNPLGASGTSWCSIGVSEDGAHEHDFAEVVEALATNASCVAIVPIGQCACYGGYPGCVSPADEFNGLSQSGAMGTYKFLTEEVGGDAGALAGSKVVNVPGCPTNPWWFILTVVAWLVDFVAVAGGDDGPLGILESRTIVGGTFNGQTFILPKASSVDKGGRLKKVYALPLHGPFCTRDADRKADIYAEQPGDPGCLQVIGCKGPQTMTLCGVHGWNGQQPRNDSSLDYGIGAVNSGKGGNCVAAGHPCMACTEAGYPDAFLPFVVR